MRDAFLGRAVLAPTTAYVSSSSVAGTVIVRNDWLPYDHGRLLRLLSQSRYFHDRVWGISDLEIIESLQQELNRMADKRSAWIELSYFRDILNPANSGFPTSSSSRHPALFSTRPTLSMAWGL